MKMIKTHVYIDGFNLYYLALKKSSYKWLDLKSLLQKLLSKDHSIQSIKYFTARVSGKLDPQQPNRQNTYIRALEAYIPEVSVHYGQFLSHEIWAPLAVPKDKNRFVKIIKTEEKGSDVNLAVHLLNDAWLNKFDCAVIVSNDGDLSEALKIVKNHHKKIIGVINPGSLFASTELRKYANFIKRIRKNVLSVSQLPNPIPGTRIHKPDSW